MKHKYFDNNEWLKARKEGNFYFQCFKREVKHSCSDCHRVNCRTCRYNYYFYVTGVSK